MAQYYAPRSAASGKSQRYHAVADPADCEELTKSACLSRVADSQIDYHDLSLCPGCVPVADHDFEAVIRRSTAFTKGGGGIVHIPADHDETGPVCSSNLQQDHAEWRRVDPSKVGTADLCRRCFAGDATVYDGGHECPDCDTELSTKGHLIQHRLQCDSQTGEEADG